MNILHIISKSDSYDTILQVLDLSNHLNAIGHNCVVVSSFSSQFADRIKAKHYHLPLYNMNIWHVYNSLKKIIKENSIDIVHTHSELSSWVGLFLSRNTSVPLVTTCYNFYSKNIFNASVILGRKVIVHHEAVGSHLINKFNLPREYLQFIRPALALENLHFYTPDERSKTEFNIGIISPLHPDKGHEYFLKAMAKVVRSIPNLKIWIATSMPGSRQNFKGDLELWVRKLNLNNFVEFFDASNLDLNILSKFNILVFFPLKEDASTRIILEAQAQGALVIASRVGAVTEIVLDNKSGVLITPKDHQALANVVIKILRDFQFQKEIVFLARKRIEEEFSLNNRTTEYADVYQKVKNETRILVINLGNVKDVILSIPALRILKKEIPQARVSVLTTSNSRFLLQHYPCIDELLVYNCLLRSKCLFDFKEIIKLLIFKRFDVTFDFSNTFITHIMSYLTLAGRRYGYKNRILRFLINYGIDRPHGLLDSVEQKLLVLKHFGIEVKDYKMELWSSEDDFEFIDNFFKDNWIGSASIAGLDISANRGFLKNFRSLEYIAYLCDKLANKDMRVIVMGSRNNIKIKEQLFKKIKSKPILAIEDISIMQWISLVKRCNIFISSNIESLNIAAFMKVPCLFLSTKKNLNKLRIYNNRNIDVLTNDELRLDKHRTKSRKYSSTAISSDMVLGKINNLINKK